MTYLSIYTLRFGRWTPYRSVVPLHPTLGKEQVDYAIKEIFEFSLKDLGGIEVGIATYNINDCDEDHEYPIEVSFTWDGESYEEFTKSITLPQI